MNIHQELQQRAKRSLDQSRCWSPEGKASKPENRNWAIKSKKERDGAVKNWVSKSDIYRKSVFGPRALAKLNSN